MSELPETLEGVKVAFQRLGLEFGASEDVVKKQYQRLALKEHPDKNPGNAEAATRFGKIQKAKELLDKYAGNPKHFPPGPSQHATGIDPFDAHIPSGGNAPSGSFASGNSRGGRARYYGADGEELFPLPDGSYARVFTADHPGTSDSAERSSRERHSTASRSGGHREGRRGSSFDRTEVTREDGVTYIERRYTNTEPEYTSHKKKGRGGEHREGRHGSSSSHRTEVREDGNTYVEIAPTRTRTEPVSTSHRKKSKSDKGSKGQFYLARDKKTGKVDYFKK